MAYNNKYSYYDYYYVAFIGKVYSYKNILNSSNLIIQYLPKYNYKYTLLVTFTFILNNFGIPLLIKPNVINC